MSVRWPSSPLDWELCRSFRFIYTNTVIVSDQIVSLGQVPASCTPYRVQPQRDFGNLFFDRRCVEIGQQLRDLRRLIHIKRPT